MTEYHLTPKLSHFPPCLLKKAHVIQYRENNYAPFMHRFSPHLELVPNCITGLYLQRFHLEGNFLPKGNIGLWKDRNKEMQCGRKSEGNLVIWMESGRKFQNS
jgi:hypothetical protein